MPKLGGNMENLAILGSKGAFQFSAVRVEDLGATEYTLVTIAMDRSGSVDSFKSELLQALKSVVGACKKSPRADNLMLRVIDFNHALNEIHGFKLLSTINENDYAEPQPAGNTALFDAVYSSVGATLTYAKKLTDQDFSVNAICFIITDGCDNSSSTTPKSIADMIQNAKIGEEIESMLTILVGINTSGCKQPLEDFQIDAKLNQFVDCGDATAQRLAKLATFVSKSISSQSMALGSGGASKPLTF